MGFLQATYHKLEDDLARRTCHPGKDSGFLASPSHETLNSAERLEGLRVPESSLGSRRAFARHTWLPLSRGALGPGEGHSTTHGAASGG